MLLGAAGGRDAQVLLGPASWSLAASRRPRLEEGVNRYVTLFLNQPDRYR
jgi:hypothetical protein